MARIRKLADEIVFITEVKEMRTVGWPRVAGDKYSTDIDAMGVGKAP